MKLYSSLAAALLAGGCANLSAQRAEMDAFQDARLPDSPQEWAVAAPAPAEKSDWVAQFGSHTLSSLIDEAMRANPDIAAAYATAEAARANYRSTYGRALPQVDASSSASYTGVLEDFGNGVENYSLGLTASWEIDLWGRIGRGVRAAFSDVDSSEADLAAIRLSIAGATARAWVSLINARAQLALTQDELEVRQNSERVTERRVGAGVASALDVRLARSAVASTRASIASAKQDVSDAARELEVLLGRYPAAAIDAPDQMPELASIRDLSNPTDLLSRRPDIAAAEARMAGAGLRAELARQAMLPRLSVSATISSSEEEFADIFDVERMAGRALANLTAPIFSGGTLKADAEAALANARVSVANYAGSIINAWNEVERAREADIHLAAQEGALKIALEEALAAEDLAERQYQRGTITIFNLIDAQTRRISSERQLLNVRAGRAANRITYHIALGGGDLPLSAAAPNDGKTAP